MLTDLVSSINNDLQFLIDTVENNRPKKCFRKYRYCNKFKKSKKFFYRNYFYDFLINSSCLCFAIRHIKKYI